MNKDLFPEEIVEMLKSLAKKVNRRILKRLSDAPIPDEDVTPEMAKSLRELGMLMMTKHTGVLVGFSENNMPVFKDPKYSLSELGQAVIQKLFEIWQVPKSVEAKNTK